MQKSEAEKVTYAYGNDNDAFAAAFNESNSVPMEIPSRILLKGKFYNLNLDNNYVRYIYQALSLGLKSEWYESLTDFSHAQITTNTKILIQWLNNIEVDDQNKFTILKDFESYRVNVIKVKPQSTGLSSILALIRAGIGEPGYRLENYNYIDGLLTRTNISKYAPPIPETLTSYFSTIGWLREEIGEENFLKLESPKRLMISFSTTIATILLHILEVKREAKNNYAVHQFVEEYEPETNCKRVNNQKYCAGLISSIGKFDGNFDASDAFTELMVLDFVPANKVDDLKVLLGNRFSNRKGRYTFRVKKMQVFTVPNIFSRNAKDFPSEFEQVLFSWLCAYQAIQPHNIPKLKKDDFVISKNSEGRNITVQCKYFKGRSSRVQEPPMLDIGSIEGKAVISYLETISGGNQPLFRLKRTSAINLTFGAFSTSERLAKMLNSERIKSEISINLWRKRASPLFMTAYMALYEKKEFGFSRWRNNKIHRENQKANLSYPDYKTSSPYPSPTLMFGLGAIKNSAVHATSDRYRDGDLVNQNSHTSGTEKVNYLTDANKDWVNQNGRITRLVLHDIEHYVYKPEMDKVHKIAHDLRIRTKVIQAVGDGVQNKTLIKVNSIGQVIYSKETYQDFDADADAILVLDTVESVVNMLHYINEAVSKQTLLIKNALGFYEKSVLPTVEWMEYLLASKLSPTSIKLGHINYLEIKSILPELFINEIRGSLGV